jgi:lysozyme
VIINDAGRKIIMDAEGVRLKAYKCPAGVWTIGYGHTGDVKDGDSITMHWAETILEYDLQRFEEGVGKLAPGASANEFSAMVSLAFNIGLSAFEKSTVLKEFRAGRKLNAANAFEAWVRGGGRVLPGLVRRRAAEKKLFLEVPS